MKGLGADRERGLSSAEAKERLARFGPNEVDEKEESLWHQVFRRFWGPIPWMIEIAAILSGLVQKWDDFTIILVMLLVNAGLDFLQEHRAQNALKALKDKLANEAIALRDILQEQGFSEDLIRSILFLKLLVAGHSTLYITRSEGWFWGRPWPAPLLFWATFGTEILGTLIAVYGLFITPIGWTYALWAWVYALVWLLIDDAVKIWAYEMLREEGGA